MKNSVTQPYHAQSRKQTNSSQEFYERNLKWKQDL